MKALPNHKRKNGYDYTLVLRGKRSCIYEQKVSETVTRYEVFLIKVQPASEYKGRYFPAQEMFPHNEAFGEWAWCCMTRDAAQRRFEELEKEGRAK